MQSTSEGCTNIIELANQLRREKTYINSERLLLQNLNEEVESSCLELLQSAWICSMQRQNLTNLITSRCEEDSIAACQRASYFEGTTFVDAFKVLKYKDASNLSELLGWLRDSPHLVAICLLLGEDNIPNSLPSALVAGLYGSCRTPSDRTRFLALIRLLIKNQLVPSTDPRKFFRTSKCILSSIYSVFRDGQTQVRQFLIATLQGPVLSVMQEDEFFLDIDPDKAMERFSPADRLKKFGQPNTPEYAAKMARYRKWTVQSLYNLTMKFIISLKEHWHSFPPVIAWIIQQIMHMLKQHGRLSDRDLHLFCTELVLGQVVCAGVASPEAHGVVESPVSNVAASNLRQIAQILHTLCLARYQEVDIRCRDVYARFERSVLWALVENVCKMHTAAPPADFPPHVYSPVALYTPAHLQQLINFLKHISSKLNNNTPSLTAEEAPTTTSGTIADTTASAYSESLSSGSSCDVEAFGTGLGALLQSMEPNYKSRLHDLLKKMPKFDEMKSPVSETKEQPTENGLMKKGILAKVPKPRLPRSGSSNSSSSLLSSSSEDKGGGGYACAIETITGKLEVLVIKLASTEETEYVGLIPESKVLECYYGDGETEAEVETEAGVALPQVGSHPPMQKRTRFSVSHDEVSLGNTSDNLEAVSEAASNHSVTSSLELETEDQNDNLSDMVSANVSGRGSPNISGRETPSSQVTDGDTTNEGSQRRLPPNVSVSQANSQQAKLLKQARNEIDEKFCKFEIKKLLEGDETVSTMSDTWSTDVLASDSETIGDSCEQTQIPNNQGSNANNATAPDVSETASESAWSMDVASDSDRNTEADTDDCVSVAARSDTSWPRRPSQQEEQTMSQKLRSAVKKPDVNSPRHAPRPNLVTRSNSYLSATAALCRGVELDLPAPRAAPATRSILLNGYPVMTCYATSAPESPSTSVPPPLQNDAFDYPENNNDAPTEESTLEGTCQSDATSQWVDDSFPAGRPDPFISASKTFDEPDLMDRSLNSSDSSFNALSASVSHYDRRFDAPIDPGRSDESRSTITDLMTRMTSATISTSANLVNNMSRIVKSEIRTSIVSISSSRIEKRKDLSGNNMSTSNLSVNSAETSASDKSTSQDVNSENVTERRISPPPVKITSTGAIPKSISFDSTAEKSERRRNIMEESLSSNLDELKNNAKRSGGSLLHKIKMFRQKGRLIPRQDVKLPEEETRSEDSTGRCDANGLESSEDILAKYRRKTSAECIRPRKMSDLADTEIERVEGVVDLNDPEVFNSMKRNLRTVLSNPDLHCVEHLPNRGSGLVDWLWRGAVCGGEAGAAQAASVARVLAMSPPDSGPRLASALRADLAARRPYAAYLASCRAALTQTLHTINRQTAVAREERQWCVRAAAATRALQLLERRGLTTRHLQEGELMDEKASRLTAIIKGLAAEVKADPSWEGAPQALIESVDLTVERFVFSRLYLQVMFPNGDGDIARDQKLSEHIRRLRGNGNGNSGPSLASICGIRAGAMWAAPFPRAAAQLYALPAARSPRDKLSCVTRCVLCIMAVLGLEGSAPAADDLTPVLVYLIIKVNPPSLLSTVDLVSAWVSGVALGGEALYCWTQFCAAIAYVKTMDYRHDS